LFKIDQEVSNLTGIENFIQKSIQLISRMRELEKIIDANQDLTLYKLEEIIIHVMEKYNGLKWQLTGKSMVLADHAIDSIFDNLIGNAIKHGQADKVDITISDYNNMCKVVVADNGVGIPENLKDEIFKENFAYGKQKGSGLGLYIVKNTVERYGGNIFVEDNKPSGTKFVMCFRNV
jgi:signal transduction histidine kinase